jgi:para-aminobenzoate synthetase/4-amino-4-deoxychorismate lyase
LGWVSYEAAPGFSPHLPVKATAPGAVYALWAVFDQAHEGWPALDASDAWHLGPWHTDLPEAEMATAIGHIHELIRAGEVYQINLTSQRQSQLAGQNNPRASSPNPSEPSTSPPDTRTLHHLFHGLHRTQPNGYALLLDARTATRSPGAVLSVSPELFFEWDGQQIITRPMKGTAPRHAQAAADQAAADHLQHSAKEKAENLMIVDLLRNDLSRVAQVGSVHVTSLFDVQALPTVWQMTSTVTARTRPEVTLADVFTALFPCGSVTGAPKQRAMHHIARLEQHPRGVYCGAMGVLMPGGHATFNVPIRTVCIDTPPPDAPWRATCGIGSGITLDASITGEQQEWRHKAIFLNRASQPFDLLESMRLENGVLLRLPLHVARLARSAQHFGFATTTTWPSWAQRVLASLTHLAAQHPTGVFKVRLLLSPQGHIKAEAQPLTEHFGMAWHPLPTASEWARMPLGPPSAAVALATAAMPPPDDFIWHKTTRRQAYQAFQAPPECMDTLLLNSSGEITEFTIGNVAIHLHGQWLTPPVSCGLLPGVMRMALLEAQLLQEARIPLAALPEATGMALMNSVRGWLPVRLKQPTPADQFL